MASPSPEPGRSKRRKALPDLGAKPLIEPKAHPRSRGNRLGVTDLRIAYHFNDSLVEKLPEPVETYKNEFRRVCKRYKRDQVFDFIWRNIQEYREILDAKRRTLWKAIQGGRNVERAKKVLASVEDCRRLIKTMLNPPVKLDGERKV